MIVWTIGGSDSGAGAGIQADIKTFNDLEVYGCSIITAITAQNSLTIENMVYLSASIIQSQLLALQSDLMPSVIKLSMLVEVDTIVAVIKNINAFFIYDPVMGSSTGSQFAFDHETITSKLLPLIDLITPNIPEAERLTGLKITDDESIKLTANKILQYGVKAVVIKGGHSEGGFCNDYFTDGKASFWLAQQRISDDHSHGSGCVFAAALAAFVARSYVLKDALVLAKMYVTQGIRLAKKIGQGAGPVMQGGFPDQLVDLPYLSSKMLSQCPAEFYPCDHRLQGLYPVVDSSDWVLRLAKLGVSVIQLRIKDKSQHQLEEEIALSVSIAKQYKLQLFINDYWQLAIKYDAFGVHLGQDDLDVADLDLLRQSGLRLGVSTHCFYEVARAHAINPSYIAIGPIYATTSKVMPFKPQGLKKLHYWRRLLNYKLVAIGGITLTNLCDVKATGVESIAAISAITQSQDLEETVKAWRFIIGLL